MTRQFTFIWAIFILLTACDNNTKDSGQVIKTTQPDTIIQADKKSTPDKLHFKNITEVIQDSYPWVKIQDSSSSLALHFNINKIDNENTVNVSFTSECWLSFPFKITPTEIIVYWDKNIDSKYDFDIVKAINKIGTKYNGKPFIILKLINDTTLQATYPFPELIEKINSSDKRRVLFPDKYVVSTTYFP